MILDTLEERIDLLLHTSVGSRAVNIAPEIPDRHLQCECMCLIAYVAERNIPADICQRKRHRATQTLVAASHHSNLRDPHTRTSEREKPECSAGSLFQDGVVGDEVMRTARPVC